MDIVRAITLDMLLKMGIFNAQEWKDEELEKVEQWIVSQIESEEME